MDLTGKLLIAMPAMGDPRFERSVILICTHSDEGALGLIVNKAIPDLSLGNLLEHLDIPRAPEGRDIRVHYGGPVERGRGFVLHSRDFRSEAATMRIGGGYGMTATLDVLEAMARGEGPAQATVALGCAGWGGGQLEQELVEDSWLLVPVAPAILFDLPLEQRWQAAAGSIGVDLVNVASHSGHA